MLPACIVIAQNLFGAFYSLLSRKLAQRLPHAQLQVSAVLMTITLCLSMPVALLHGVPSLADLAGYWPYFLIAGLATAMNSALLLVIFRYMDAAMGSLLTTINIVAAVVAAIAVLNEHFGLQEIVGAAIVLAAVTYAMAVHVSRRERRNWTLGLLFTLLSAGCYAVGATAEKYLLGQVGVASYLVWGWGAQWAFALVLSLLFGARHFAAVFHRRNTALLVATGLMRSGMGLLFVASLVVLKSLCVAVVLAGLRPLFVAFLGAEFLHERRFLKRKIVASLVAAVGVAVMFL